MAFLFCLTIFVSSGLLFLVQPMCAKAVLPRLGGTPAVWNTCMVFFQAGLLAGYAYAHYLPGRLGLRRHALLHVAALAVALFALPLTLAAEPADAWHPALWLLFVLTRAVAVPFVLVASGGPLLQRWYAAGAKETRDPYFLYAASNLGSFAALVSYPLLVEPNLTLAEQGWLWAGGFVALIGLTVACVPWRVAHVAKESEARPTDERRITWTQRGRWVLLALIPSSLLLSVTSHLTTDLAPIPLLWVVPLGLYLLTFTLVFAGRPLVPHALIRRWLPLVVVVVVLVLLSEATTPLPLILGIHLVAFVWLALACHGELARTRPPARDLTGFYLCLAVGGVLGGLFNAFAAPLLFPGPAEYPLMLVLAALCCSGPVTSTPSRADLRWGLLLGVATVAFVAQACRSVALPPGPASVAVLFAIPLLLTYTFHERPWRFAVALAGLLLAGGLYDGIHGTTVYRERSPFGVHRVTEVGGLRRLVHGNTVHGQQSLRPVERQEPLTYYHRASPIGRLVQALADDARLERVGVVGLGAGSLAAYSQPGQTWTFYEIDPAVIRIAQDPRLFTFLSDAKGTVRVVPGDARVQLRRSSDRFGLLVVDAFGSDAIPLHLLTREALRLYLDRLDDNGLLAFHVSNRYLDLEPVLAGLAAEANLECRVWRDQRMEDPERGISPSEWVVIARRPEDLKAARAGDNSPWRRAQTRPGLRAWTDDFSNIWQALRRDGTGE